MGLCRAIEVNVASRLEETSNHYMISTQAGSACSHGMYVFSFNLIIGFNFIFVWFWLWLCMAMTKENKINPGKIQQRPPDAKDHYTFLRNCPPTPPLREHFALSEMLAYLGEGYVSSFQ